MFITLVILLSTHLNLAEFGSYNFQTILSSIAFISAFVLVHFYFSYTFSVVLKKYYYFILISKKLYSFLTSLVVKDV